MKTFQSIMLIAGLALAYAPIANAEVRVSEIQKYCEDLFPRDKVEAEKLFKELTLSAQNTYASHPKLEEKPELSVMVEKIGQKVKTAEDAIKKLQAQITDTERFRSEFNKKISAQRQESFARNEQRAREAGAMAGYSDATYSEEFNGLNQTYNLGVFAHLMGTKKMSENAVKDAIYGTRLVDGGDRDPLTAKGLDGVLAQWQKDIQLWYRRIDDLNQIAMMYPHLKSPEEFTKFLDQSRKECEQVASGETVTEPSVRALSNKNSTFQKGEKYQSELYYFFYVTRAEQQHVEKYRVGGAPGKIAHAEAVPAANSVHAPLGNAKDIEADGSVKIK